MAGRGDSDSEEGKTAGSSENMVMQGDESTATESTSEQNGLGPACKAVRTGKQYACPHCSYSADKKVSLNRHMRMHSSSPVTAPAMNGIPGAGEGLSNSPEMAATLLNSPHLVDRYCQDCDIRFSSIKTFRAHKLHYCSTRHVVKAPPGVILSTPLPKTPSTVESAPTSPIDVISRSTPSPASVQDASHRNNPSNHLPPQPFLALPTNPILIVPYSLFQNASFLTGPAAMAMANQDAACILLPNGTLQPMAQGILSQSLSQSIPNSIQTQKLPIKEETSSQSSRSTAQVTNTVVSPAAPLQQVYNCFFTKNWQLESFI